MRKLVVLAACGLLAVADEPSTRELPAILDARGQVEFGRGRYRDDRKYFERALHAPMEQTASRAATLGNAGLACLALGDNRQAERERYFREGLELTPDHAGLLHGLGQSLVAQKKLGDGKVSYRKALQSSEPRRQVWSDLALLLDSRGRRDEAISLLLEAIASCPTGQARARMLANLGVLEWKTGARQNAVAHLRQSLAEMEAAIGTTHPE